MTSASAFTPDWVSPPGDTIADILDDNNLTTHDFAQRMECSEQTANKLLSGRTRITPRIASQLQETTGASSEFWLKRESIFRERLRAQQRREKKSNAAEWLCELPLNDLIRFGWVERKSTTRQQVNACLGFFGVSDIESWRSRYGDVLREAAFRTSPTYVSHPGAVGAWLRQGEIEGHEIKCSRWDPAAFRDAIADIRSLTREKDPRVFVPALKSRCASCGVAVVVVRAPKGCRASGASLFLTPRKALINLSFRYLSDDHFWYTFSHEAGHLMLHGKKDLFVDGDDIQSTKEEEEANEFAATTLIPPEFQKDLSKLRANGRHVIRFAKRAGVSPGIVVGQLQHFGTVRRNQLNNLKNWYKWGTDHKVRPSLKT